MRKLKFLTVLVLLLSLNSFAQWEKRFYVDDFGDATTQGYETFTANGTFSNSATQNSTASYKFIKDATSIIINVYEYGSSLATSIDATFEEVKIKQPSGAVVTVQGAFFSKGGYLLFSKKKFTELKDAISSKGKYILIFDRGGEYSNSNYKIKFTIN